MKRAFTSIAIAIALVGFTGITGCGDDAGDRDGADTTAMDTSGLDVDSGAGGTEVSADEKNFSFEGTVTSVSGDMVTIDHEEIGDYKPAGSNSFKLASSDMAQYAKTGQRMDFDLKVVGAEALITKMEADNDDNDTTGARVGDNDNDLDTIGRNDTTNNR
jgi:hypothetical protein